jgi:hypothetical protein
MHLTRIFHDSPAATTDMAVLLSEREACVLGRSFGEGTCPERSEGGQAHPATHRSGTETNPAVRLPGGTPILFAHAALRSVPQAGSQFHGLETAIEDPCSKLQGIFEM